MSKEHEPQPLPNRELELVQDYAAVFLNRMDVYPVQQPKGHYLAIHQPLTLRLLWQHLQGQVTLGAYALSADSRAKWVCFDADGDLQWTMLLQLALHLEAQGLVPYREHSRRGGHLWLFLPTAVPGGLARRFGRQLLLEQGADDKQIELYPKQDKHRSGDKAIGSLVRLPLGVHRLTGVHYPFVDSDGQPLAPTVGEQIQLLRSPMPVPFPFLMQTTARAPQPKLITPSTPFRPTREITGTTLSERVKNAISVLDFVSRYVDLDQNLKGFCPFHDDEHMSFQVNALNNYWHCYAGCSGQTVIDFWMKWRQVHGQDWSFTTTVKDLAQMLL